MASDVYGDPKQFGLVIPVPTVIKRDQVRVVHPETVGHLGDYTKPRLVEYYDPDPCPPKPPEPGAWDRLFGGSRPQYPPVLPAPMAAAPVTVHIEAKFSVEEYNIIILSATDSGDLLTYLNKTGYKMPAAAQDTVRSYIRQHMHFFLAKLDLAKVKGNTSGFLRPLQVSYNSPKFMLPIRLGTVNADGPQDMIVLGLTQKGRIETTNYRTVKVPTSQEIPLYVQTQFGQFYDAVFDRQVQENAQSAVFLEYAWNMNTCDPCSAQPMTNDELRELGANWVQTNTWQQPVFITRLHIRYDREHFPEDLLLQETPDTESFQARYVLQHPFTGPSVKACKSGHDYEAALPARFAKEAGTLEQLTGWVPGVIQGRMHQTGQSF
jgi:hypothetical protein